VERLTLVDVLAGKGAEGGSAKNRINKEQPADSEPYEPVPSLTGSERVPFFVDARLPLLGILLRVIWRELAGKV
jgi:hypothetical protein